MTEEFRLNAPFYETFREPMILSKLEHPYITKLEGVVKTSDSIYSVYVIRQDQAPKHPALSLSTRAYPAYQYTQRPFLYICSLVVLGCHSMEMI